MIFQTGRTWKENLHLFFIRNFETKMIIYRITNKLNGRIYIGKRSLMRDDFNKSNYWGSGLYIKRAIKKYGKENFTRDVICECMSLSEMNDREVFYIGFYNSIQPNGYNIQKGGQGGDTGRRKGDKGYLQSQKNMKGNTYRKGKTAWNKGLKKGVDDRMRKCGIVSKERNKLVSKALKGKPKSEKHKLKMSGENCNNHKLKWDDVFKIRNMYSEECYTQTKIADIFGMDQSTISDIINNKIWIKL